MTDLEDACTAVYRAVAGGWRPTTGDRAAADRVGGVLARIWGPSGGWRAELVDEAAAAGTRLLEDPAEIQSETRAAFDAALACAESTVVRDLLAAAATVEPQGYHPGIEHRHLLAAVAGDEWTW